MTKRDERSEISRREFLGALTAMGAGLMAMPALAQEATTATLVGGAKAAGAITMRKLGREGVQVSLLGLGGAHMAGKKDEKHVERMVHMAIDNGVTFMDNAWEYSNGFAEEAMGKALVGRRDKAFLMTKVCTHGRGKDVAMQQLEESLKRLRTDHLDLWQIHEVVRPNEPDLHFQEDGVMEAMEEAKKAGKVRFLGFTGHKDPAILMKMLSHKYPFDSCQMPLNAFDATHNSFEKIVLPELQKQGISAIAMKTMGGNAKAIKDGVVTAQEALRYAMSLPISTVVSGMTTVEQLEENMQVARDFKPMTPAEMDALRKRCAEAAATGKYEEYKTPVKWDGAVGKEMEKQQQEKK